MLTRIEPVPSMDELGLECFKDKISSSKSYLEYGSGGSTIFATNIAKISNIISVESDKEWNEKVKLSIIEPAPSMHIEHCDIGEVGDWGIPKNRDGMNNYWKYAFLPWEISQEKSIAPDLVLIDGRFRVASFLISLLYSRSGTTILFDDYVDRPNYFVVEKFCELKEKHGRMGLFVSDKNYSNKDLVRTIASHIVIWN